MRRSLGGLILLASCVLIALSASTFWLHRVAFSPSTDGDATAAILTDDEIRTAVATLVATADGPALEQSSAQLREFVDGIARIDDGAALMSGFVRDAHARVLGDRDEAVQITAAEQVTIVRDERVAQEAPITLPVREVGSVSLIDGVTWWTAIISAVVGLLGLVGGALFRPEKGEPALAIGVGLGALAVLLPVFGWLVPVVLLPTLSDDTWMGIFPALANDARVWTFGIAAVAAVLALVIVARSANSRQRRQSSTPLAVGRYREQHRWSR